MGPGSHGGPSRRGLLKSSVQLLDETRMDSSAGVIEKLKSVQSALKSCAKGESSCLVLAYLSLLNAYRS